MGTCKMLTLESVTIVPIPRMWETSFVSRYYQCFWRNSGCESASDFATGFVPYTDFSSFQMMLMNNLVYRRQFSGESALANLEEVELLWEKCPFMHAIAWSAASVSDNLSLSLFCRRPISLYTCMRFTNHHFHTQCAVKYMKWMPCSFENWWNPGCDNTMNVRVLDQHETDMSQHSRKMLSNCYRLLAVYITAIRLVPVQGSITE